MKGTMQHTYYIYVRDSNATRTTGNSNEIPLASRVGRAKAENLYNAFTDNTLPIFPKVGFEIGIPIYPDVTLYIRRTK